VAADAIVFERMRECGAVETASSEEKPELVPLGGSGYSVRPACVAAGPLHASFVLERKPDMLQQRSSAVTLEPAH